MSIKLWGQSIEPQYDFDGFVGYEEVRRLVATFDTVELAEAYVRASRARHGGGLSWSGPSYDRYKQDSLLRNCTNHEIEEPGIWTPPHNPTLD
jgi:hypothetical protein